MSLLQAAAMQGAVAGAARRFLVGGHRGVGENLYIERGLAAPTQSPAVASCIVPSFRENTVKSFLRAAELGCDFIEFDAQVTSDGTPVIWHDDTVLQQRSSGQPVTATQVKDLTLQSFRQVVGSSSAPGQLVRHFRGAKSRAPLPQEHLPWDCAVEDTLPTLAEVFASVPQTVGFDVEIKMTEGDDVPRTPPEEVDRVVSSIWSVVKDHVSLLSQQPAHDSAVAGGQAAALALEQPRREIFFSSFDPDVCEAIRQKQAVCDVWFLSGCGLYTHVDPRRTSIAAALAFARDKHLTGVVLPAQVLLANEAMVRDAAALGLKLMTYGLENDDEEAVTRQRNLGISGAIVDDVQALMTKRQQLVAASN